MTTDPKQILPPGDQGSPGRSLLVRRGTFAVLLALAVSFAGALVYLTFSIRQEINLLAETELGDLQFRMMQFDNEIYRFLSETNAEHEHTHDHSDADHIKVLRSSFNGMVAFVEAMNTDPVFAYLREAPDAARALGRLTAFMQRFEPIINGPRVGLVHAMDRLHDASYALPGFVLAIKQETTSTIANSREMRRRESSQALNSLTYLTLGFVALVLMVFAALGGFYRATLQVAAAESALRNRVEAVVASAQDAVVVTDQRGAILHFNSAAEKMFGTRREDMAQRNAIYVLSAEDAQAALFRRMWDMGNSVLADGKTVFDRFVHTVVRADGSLFPAEVSISVSAASGGLLFVQFIRDISTRLATEREMKAARDRALAGEKAKSNFLAVMSHEIRTPLNGLLGTMSLLEDTKLNKTQQNYLANMQRSGQLLREHVDDVLDIARFEAGNQPEIVDIDLGALIGEVVENQVHLATIRENEVSGGWVGEPAPLLRCDPRLLRQVLINLVGNGVKFTHQGTVRVEAEIIETREGRMVELRVIDSGPGIAPEHQDSVFKDFERVDSSLTRQTSGTGLGLGIARRMTEALEGEIGVKSVLGEGATFWLRFPYVPALGQPAVAVPVSERVDMPLREARRKHVLLVEDNEINRQVLSQMLISDGHSVVQAANGRIGVDAARQEPFDLILMDVSMPVMDGPTAIGLIRGEDGPNVATDIVVVTAHVMLREYARFKSLGAEGYMKKPIDRTELRDIMAGHYVWPEGLEEEEEVEEPPEIDVTQLEVLLDALGSDKLAGLLETFFAESDALIATLQSGEADDATVMLVHKFAGSAAIVGAVELHTRLGEFETLAKDETPEAARTVHAEEIARLSRATRDALQEWMSE